MEVIIKRPILEEVCYVKVDDKELEEKTIKLLLKYLGLHEYDYDFVKKLYLTNFFSEEIIEQFEFQALDIITENLFE